LNKIILNSNLILESGDLGSQKAIVKYNFGVLELALALFIIFTGLTGVMGVFSTGLNSQKNTFGSNLSINSAEQFLQSNSIYAKSDPDWLNVFPNSKPDFNESGIDWSAVSIHDQGHVTIYPDFDFDPLSTDNSGFFLLEQTSQSEVDYRAILRVWKDVTVGFNGGETTVLHVEISWPAEKPYYSREKSIFSMEHFNSPEIALTD